MSAIHPFQNESEAVEIGDLKVENRQDRIQIYGTLQVTRDGAGLRDALALQRIVNATVAALQAEPDLPERLTLTNAPRPSAKDF